jgi:L-threonylcarbamoyladenylate synthase
VNQLKNKPPGSPIMLLLAATGQVSQVADHLPSLFEPLAQRFWPGPLTLVIPSAAGLPEEVGGSRGTVAVRVPGLALPRRIAARLGRPISGVSANRHGDSPCRSASDVARTFSNELEMILDGGTTASGAPSTMLDLTGPRPRVLREGVLPVFSLRPFLSGPIAVDSDRS